MLSSLPFWQSVLSYLCTNISKYSIFCCACVFECVCVLSFYIDSPTWAANGFHTFQNWLLSMTEWKIMWLGPKIAACNTSVEMCVVSAASSSSSSVDNIPASWAVVKHRAASLSMNPPLLTSHHARGFLTALETWLMWNKRNLTADSGNEPSLESANNLFKKNSYGCTWSPSFFCKPRPSYAFSGISFNICLRLFFHYIFFPSYLQINIFLEITNSTCNQKIRVLICQIVSLIKITVQSIAVQNIVKQVPLAIN